MADRLTTEPHRRLRRARQLGLFEMPESERIELRRQFEALKAQYLKRYLSETPTISQGTYKLRSKLVGIAGQLWPDYRAREEQIAVFYNPSVDKAK